MPLSYEILETKYGITTHSTLNDALPFFTKYKLFVTVYDCRGTVVFSFSPASGSRNKARAFHALLKDDHIFPITDEARPRFGPLLKKRRVIFNTNGHTGHASVPTLPGPLSLCRHV